MSTAIVDAPGGYGAPSGGWYERSADDTDGGAVGKRPAPSEANARGGVVVEELGVADVAANDCDRAVAGLLHDGPLALAGLRRPPWRPRSGGVPGEQGRAEAGIEHPALRRVERCGSACRTTRVSTTEALAARAIARRLKLARPPDPLVMHPRVQQAVPPRYRLRESHRWRGSYESFCFAAVSSAVIQAAKAFKETL